MNISALLEKCQALGAVLIPVEDRLRVRAPHPLPDDLMAELKEAKSLILAELGRQRDQDFENWILKEWRRTSIPSWRRVLQESIDSKDSKREAYARWMLREVLEDPEYRENQ